MSGGILDSLWALVETAWISNSEYDVSMSIDHSTDRSGDLPGDRESIDVSGLPVPIVRELERLVATLRGNLGPTRPTAGPLRESPEQWIRRLQAWVDSNPARPIEFDDSRESIYAGRGE